MQTDWVDPDDDTPKEACGVFGVYAPDQAVSHLTYLGLYALQHRGQEAAGMAVSDGSTVTVVKDTGLVSNAFDDRTLAALTGHLAIGHTRYSTTGSSVWHNAQPVYRNVGAHTVAIAHNGNLVNTAELADQLGMLPGTVSSDSDVMAELLASELAKSPDESSDHRALERAMQGLRATTVVHICYGYGIEANIQWKASLGDQWRQYEQIFPWINASSVQQVSLEFAGSRVPHEVLRLLPDKTLLVGAIEVLPGKLESAEEVAHNILEATRHVDSARLIPCTNCGMAPLPAALARSKLQALGAGAALARRAR